MAISHVSIRFITFGIGVGILYLGAPIILPLLFAFFLFLLLDPIVEWAGRKKFSRRVAASVVVFLSMVFVIATGFAFYKSVMKVMDRLPGYSAKIEQFSKRLHTKTRSIQKSTDLILEGPTPTIAQKVQQVEIVGPKASPFASFIMHGFNSVLNWVSMVFFIPLISFFMLIERDFLMTRFRKIFSDEALFLKSYEEIKEISRGFFIGNIVLALSMAICFACVFTYMRLEGTLEFSLFAGVLNLIPVFGALMGAFLPSIQALMQFDGLAQPLWILLASVVIHFIGNNLVLPKILGSRINVNGTAAVIGFLFWGALWGAMGLFLAIPLMSILRIFLISNDELCPYANLISRTPISGTSRIYGIQWFSSARKQM